MQRLICFAIPTMTAVGIITLGWTSSGAPARVHVIDAIGVTLAFLLPALFADRPATLRRRWPLMLLCIVGGTLVWDFLSAQVRKREFFMGGMVLYPGAVLVFGSLLFGCAALRYAITKV